MATKVRTKIFPHFWYAEGAEEAARFYASIFPDSRVDRVTTLLSETPSGPPGSVKVVDFTLLGQRFQAITAGPHHEFNDAISMVVVCDDPASITDAYATIKVLNQRSGRNRFRVLVNMAEDEGAAMRLFARLLDVTDRYLDVGLDFAGQVPRDPRIAQAVRRRQCLMQTAPDGPAGRVRGLEHEHLAAGLGEPDRGGEAVRPRADDDHVTHVAPLRSQ